MTGGMTVTDVTLDTDHKDVISSLQTSRPEDLVSSLQQRTGMDGFDFSVTDNHSYSSARFYTAPTSDGARTTVRVQGWLDDAFGAVRKQFPVYASLSEFIRDAIVHRLHSLQSDDPAFNAVRAQYEAWAAVAADRDQQTAIRDTYRLCQDDWQNAETEHEIARAQERIARVVAETTDPEWKRRFASITKKSQRG